MPDNPQFTSPPSRQYFFLLRQWIKVHRGALTEEIQKKTEKHPEGTDARKPGLQPKDMVGHYRIIRPMGDGGMAEVYLVRPVT